MKTPDLFDLFRDVYGVMDLPPFQMHSATSFEAAKSMRADATSLRAKVFRMIRDSGARGMTDAELYEQFPKRAQNSIRPRRVELSRSGHLIGTDRTRKTPSGRMATVWIAVGVEQKESDES